MLTARAWHSVTTVGATTGIAPEVAASFSGGGFSNVFSQPSYQAAAVSRYLSTLGGENAGRFNRSGRAYPDIAAQGENVEIVFGGQRGPVSSTACSTPIVASVVALLNDLLAQQGRPPLGFLNPLLYSLGGTAAFTDVVSGSNPGCGTEGFPALAGWDPVSATMVGDGVALDGLLTGVLGFRLLGWARRISRRSGRPSVYEGGYKAY
ncbi:Tripeptidyl-peptidase SED2 [Trametes pubescens]|uniref:Tripeptidyl-peptidase SED2 n=1 Tax=Trametes pubescens TaxID=154538 RepID=A0A1M2VCS7_TRAPU|nr:Tripeptidyl-peptidase SED2 [Trametes pubescens]